jgi:hypothetical protein
MKPFGGKINLYKGQPELNLDFSIPDIPPIIPEQLSWREIVGEEKFRSFLIENKIGPGLFDRVVIDGTDINNPIIVTVNGRSYEDWNDSFKNLGGPDHHWAK